MIEKKVWKALHQDHEIVSTIKAAIRYVAERHQLTEHEVFELCTKDLSLKIPATVLADKRSPLEAIVGYLKEEHALSFSEIAALLNRDDRTIWTTYHNAQKKGQEPRRPTDFLIPLMLLSDRKVSILEAAVEYLSEACQLKVKDISALLRKSESTIRTAVFRAKRKRKNES
jgi:DNA-directed RNA polymerase specialized sigma24 family protein